MVFCGLVIAWRLAITCGAPVSMMEAQLLVVPRSMPSTFVTGPTSTTTAPRYPRRLPRTGAGVTPSRSGRLLLPALPLLRRHRHPHEGRAQQPAVERVAPLQLVDHGWRLNRLVVDPRHRFVEGGVERRRPRPRPRGSPPPWGGPGRPR